MTKSRVVLWLLAGLVVLNVLLLSWLFFGKSDKVMYVDSNKLLSGYKGMVDARSEYNKKESVWKSNVDTLTQDVQDAMRAYNEAVAKGGDKEKARALIASRQKQLYDYQNAIKQNASDEEGKVNQQVFSTINTFLESYGKSHHYRFILIAANGNMAYADKDADITSEVVDALNKEYYPLQAKK